MVYNAKGCFMPNTKLSLERIILHLWNREMQNNKFNLILNKFNEYLQKKTLKGVVFLQ